MRKITAVELRAKCYEVLDEIPSEGLAVTKRGKTVAILYPGDSSIDHLIGAIPDLKISGNVFSTEQ